jgi:diguanylate cyclase (GGDEF)-like protein
MERVRMSVRPNRSSIDLSEMDRAIGVVRILLSVVVLAVLGTRRLADQHAGQTRLLLAGVLFAASLAVWTLPRRLRDPDGLGWQTRADLCLQVVDTVGFLLLVAVVGDALPDVAWAVLVLPMVTASLRFGARGILVTWACGATGYVGLLYGGFVAVGSGGFDATVAQRPGALLVIAVAAAVLAQWLQEGWLEQAELRENARARYRRILSIESAGRAMRRLPADQVLTTCLSYAVDLGFAAASSVRNGLVDHCVGDGTLIPRCELTELPLPGQVCLTRWTSPSGREVFSASALETSSGTVVVGWRAEPIDDDLGQAFRDLITHASTARDTADLLATLRGHATVDALTGVANRRELDRHLLAATAGPGPHAILLLDLDGFKQINDTHGHLVGDQVLTAVARRVADTVGRFGLTARFGGDEFMVVLSGPPADHAETLADSLLRAVAVPVEVDGLTLQAGFSIGVAVSDGPVAPTSLQADADTAVYAAKAAGRGVARVVDRRQRATLPQPGSRIDRNHAPAPGSGPDGLFTLEPF